MLFNCVRNNLDGLLFPYRHTLIITHIVVEQNNSYRYYNTRKDTVERIDTYLIGIE